MKNLIFCILLSTPLFAQNASIQLGKDLEAITAVVQSSGKVDLACTEKPKIVEGEGKVSFECGAFPEPQTDEEKKAAKYEQETISFYRQQESDYQKSHGIVLRTRVSDDGQTSDMTVKFRPSSNDDLLLEPTGHASLKGLSKREKKRAKDASTETKKVDSDYELKCEADVSYGNLLEAEKRDADGNKLAAEKREANNNAESCSFTSKGTVPTANHYSFLKNVGASGLLEGDKLDLSKFKKTDIRSTSWKDPTATAISKKGVSFERWNVGGKCIFEVSAKFEVTENEDAEFTDEQKAAKLQEDLKAEYDRVINSILGKFKDFKPADVQGNKTRRALEFSDAVDSKSK